MKITSDKTIGVLAVLLAGFVVLYILKGGSLSDTTTRLTEARQTIQLAEEGKSYFVLTEDGNCQEMHLRVGRDDHSDFRLTLKAKFVGEKHPDSKVTTRKHDGKVVNCYRSLEEALKYPGYY